jgi:hypothetical protein
VFTGNSSTETVEVIDNTVLSGLLDYASLSQKTVPFRLGLTNISMVKSGQGEGDIVEVTDVSGSMAGQKLEAAQNASKLLADIVLNSSGNRVGLVSYEDSTRDTHDLSSNLTSINAQIDGYYADGGTCICCGINSSINILNSQSSPDRIKRMVVMSDGEANQECTHNYCEWRCIWIWCFWDCDDDAAKRDAIDFACDAYNNYNITVDAVGFGADVDNETMQNISDCGNGSYYYADVGELADIYEQIAKKFVNISFSEQRVNITGNFSNTLLYPDSYIEYSFDRENASLGFRKITQTEESPNLMNSTGYVQTDEYVEGSFDVPSGVTVTDARITSYSSQYWTDNSSIKNLTTSDWTSVFLLDDYGLDYTDLGDPYIVRIPEYLVEEGQTNYVRIGTGIAPINATGGSPYSKVIYTYRFSASVGYGNIFSSEGGAVSDALDRLDQTLVGMGVSYNESGINVSSRGASSVPSLWGPTRFILEVWR